MLELFLKALILGLKVIVLLKLKGLIDLKGHIYFLILLNLVVFKV